MTEIVDPKKRTHVRIDGEPPVQILVFTSSLICIPTLVALRFNRWGDVYITSLQAVCSLWFHSSHTRIALYADQISMWILITHTFLLAVRHWATPFLFVLGFGYILLVYVYGKRINAFCFDPDTRIADAYHASIHILGILIYSGSMMILPHDTYGIFDSRLFLNMRLQVQEVDFHRDIQV